MGTMKSIDVHVFILALYSIPNVVITIWSCISIDLVDVIVFEIVVAWLVNVYLLHTVCTVGTNKNCTALLDTDNFIEC